MIDAKDSKDSIMVRSICKADSTVKAKEELGVEKIQQISSDVSIVNESSCAGSTETSTEKNPDVVVIEEKVIPQLSAPNEFEPKFQDSSSVIVEDLMNEIVAAISNNIDTPEVQCKKMQTRGEVCSILSENEPEIMKITPLISEDTVCKITPLVSENIDTPETQSEKPKTKQKGHLTFSGCEPETTPLFYEDMICKISSLVSENIEASAAQSEKPETKQKDLSAFSGCEPEIDEITPLISEDTICKVMDFLSKDIDPSKNEKPEAVGNEHDSNIASEPPETKCNEKPTKKTPLNLDEISAIENVVIDLISEEKCPDSDNSKTNTDKDSSNSTEKPNAMTASSESHLSFEVGKSKSVSSSDTQPGASEILSSTSANSNKGSHDFCKDVASENGTLLHKESENLRNSEATAQSLNSSGSHVPSLSTHSENDEKVTCNSSELLILPVATTVDKRSVSLEENVKTLKPAPSLRINNDASALNAVELSTSCRKNTPSDEYTDRVLVDKNSGMHKTNRNVLICDAMTNSNHVNNNVPVVNRQRSGAVSTVQIEKGKEDNESDFVEIINTSFREQSKEKNIDLIELSDDEIEVVETPASTLDLQCEDDTGNNENNTGNYQTLSYVGSVNVQNLCTAPVIDFPTVFSFQQAFNPGTCLITQQLPVAFNQVVTNNVSLTNATACQGQMARRSGSDHRHIRKKGTECDVQIKERPSSDYRSIKNGISNEDTIGDSAPVYSKSEMIEFASKCKELKIPLKRCDSGKEKCQANNENKIAKKSTNSILKTVTTTRRRSGRKKQQTLTYVADVSNSEEDQEKESQLSNDEHVFGETFSRDLSFSLLSSNALEDEQDCSKSDRTDSSSTSLQTLPADCTSPHPASKKRKAAEELEPINKSTKERKSETKSIRCNDNSSQSSSEKINTHLEKETINQNSEENLRTLEKVISNNNISKGSPLENQTCHMEIQEVCETPNLECSETPDTKTENNADSSSEESSYELDDSELQDEGPTENDVTEDPALNGIDAEPVPVTIDSKLSITSSKNIGNVSSTKPLETKLICAGAAPIHETIDSELSVTSGKNTDTVSSTKPPEAKQYECIFCDRTFHNPYDMKQHFTEHIKAMVVSELVKNQQQCVFCEKPLHSKDALKFHMQRKHMVTDHPKHGCGFCPAWFISADELQKHFDQQHKPTLSNEKKVGSPPHPSTSAPSVRCDRMSDDNEFENVLSENVLGEKKVDSLSTTPQERVSDRPVRNNSRTLTKNQGNPLKRRVGRPSNNSSMSASKIVEAPVSRTRSSKVSKTSADLPNVSENPSGQKIRSLVNSVSHSSSSSKNCVETMPVSSNKQKCKFCKMELPTVASLERHIRNHHPTTASRKNTYVCDVCSCSFPLASHLDQHIRVFHGDQLDNNEKDNLQKPETNRQQFICPICKKETKKLYTLMWHMRAKHADVM